MITYHHVRPTGASAEYAKGRKQHRNMAEHVVARANPCGTHVGIPRPVGPQETERSRVGD